MKFVLFMADGDAPRLGILHEDGILDASAVLAPHATPQATMVALIDQHEALRPTLERLAETTTPFSLDGVHLLAPLPRPGKIVNCIANYWEHEQREPRPLNMFLKNPDAVIGPGDTIQLPDFTEPYAFMHEAELALVFRGPAKSVARDDWRSAIFGYTCLVDVTARESGRRTWRNNSWMGKSFDTFAPIGPCIVTADEIEDPNNLWVQFWNDGQLRHNYITDDMEHPVPEIVEFVTTIMTMHSGDVVACGTNHEGLGFIQDGERLKIKIHGIGEMELNVSDPLNRSWERGIYMGENSTNPEAVRRNRPEAIRKPAVAPNPHG